MKLGIDYVSTVILVVAVVISMIKPIPLFLRNLVIAGACLAIGIYRLRLGASGLNAAFVGLAFIFSVTYVIYAIKSLPRR